VGANRDYVSDRFFVGEEKPSVAIAAAGGFGFTYVGRIVDLVGLNNVQMAHALKNKIGVRDHASFDPETFFRLKPI